MKPLIKKIFYLIFILFCFKAIAQNNINNLTLKSADIKWVSQWPNTTDLKKTNNLSSRFNEIVLGKKRYLLSKPVALLTDSLNNFWVLDQGNNAIIEINENIGQFPHFIEKNNSEFPSLVGICNFKNDDMLVTDSYNNKIYYINNSKKEFKSINDSLKLNRPTGIAYSKTNNVIWVVETGEHRLLMLNDKGEIIKSIGKRGNEKGNFNYPTHICVDKAGNAYVVDAMNFRIQVFNKDGEVISCFGTHGDVTGSFANPKGIAVDTYNNIYVVDALLNNVQIFDINGNLLYYFGSKGTEKEQFWLPSGIFINSQNKIFIADCYNSRIQMYELINCLTK